MASVTVRNLPDDTHRAGQGHFFHDMMTPFKAAQGLIKAIAGAQVVKITRSRHSMMAEQPDQVPDALRSFLAKD